MALASLLAASLFAGCTVDELDLAGRQCPCVAGYICVESLNLCVRGDGGGTIGEDGGPMAMEDGGPPDPIDGGPPGMDGGPSPTDGGEPPPIDGGGGIDAEPPTSNCDGPLGSRLFCDGFEDGTLDAWDGTSTTATATIVSDPVYMGDDALRVFADVGPSYGEVWKAVFPGTAVDQWLRAYYYFPAADGFGVEVNAFAEYDFTYDLVVSIRTTDVDFHSHGLTPDVGTNTPASIAADRWICIELHTHFGATDGAVEVYFDDALVLEQTGLAFEPPRGLANISAKFRWKNAKYANTVYIDEVVADTSRIGCD